MLLAVQMHVALDVKLQAIVDEHKEAKKKGTNFNVTKTRTQDFVDVLLELPGEHGEEHMDDTTIKALILVSTEPQYLNL